eukprot:jgi/Mesvir1/13811/Mv15965-RA.1
MPTFRMEQCKSCRFAWATDFVPSFRAPRAARNACASQRNKVGYSCSAILPKQETRTTENSIPVPYPLDWDFRLETRESCQLASVKYPALRDLFDSGELVCLERPADYQERRDDGYLEPQTIFLLGTCHVSNRSADAARRVINAVKPESVVVELCRSRVGMMFRDPADDRVSDDSPGAKQRDLGQPNAWGVSGESFASAMGRTLRLGGRSALALRLLLAGMSANASSATGVAVGEEFAAAREAADAVGAQLVLGDRPIEITLKRAWAAMGTTEQLRFLWTIAGGGQKLRHALQDPRMLDGLQSDDAVDRLYASLAALFPSLAVPLIHERDRYLAWSLKRSKAVNGASIVVGVLGRGHLRGVTYALRHDQDGLRFKDLVGVGDGTSGPTSLLASLVDSLRVDVAFAVLLWLAYTVVNSLTGH